MPCPEWVPRFLAVMAEAEWLRLTCEPTPGDADRLAREHFGELRKLLCGDPTANKARADIALKAFKQGTRLRQQENRRQADNLQTLETLTPSPGSLLAIHRV